MLYEADRTDDKGRLIRGRLVRTVSTREPEFDEIDRAMINAVLDFQADKHSCGRPLSESLKDDDPDWQDPLYQVGVQVCMACMAYDKYQAAHRGDDKTLTDAGRDPSSWRIHTLVPKRSNRKPPE